MPMRSFTAERIRCLRGRRRNPSRPPRFSHRRRGTERGDPPQFHRDIVRRLDTLGRILRQTSADHEVEHRRCQRGVSDRTPREFELICLPTRTGQAKEL